jgi:hypothetical protein
MVTLCLLERLMPVHRTISTVAARHFLKNLTHDSRIPDDARNTALELLGHFPTAPDVLTLAKRGSYLKETVGISHTLFYLGEGEEAELLQGLIQCEDTSR